MAILTFEQLALVRTRLKAGEKREAVLASVQLDEDAFRDAVRELLAEVAYEMIKPAVRKAVR